MPDKQHLLDFQPRYKCPECEREFTNPDELQWIHFTDGEVRKQCVYCPFHQDEVEDYRKDIHELDFDN